MKGRKEVFLFLNGSRKLSGDELASLLMKYRETGSVEIEKEILLGTLWIIAMTLSKFASKVESQDFEDLRDEGFLGLMYAVENHRPEEGPFIPYAEKCIRGYILMYIRKNRLMPIPGRLKKKVGRITSLLEEGLTVQEASLELGMSEKEILDALKSAVKAEPVESILPYEEHAGMDLSAEDKWLNEEMRRFLTAAIRNVLKERDADIVMSAYGLLNEKKSAKELAEKHHLTEQRIGQILKESALKLRETVRSSGYD